MNCPNCGSDTHRHCGREAAQIHSNHNTPVMFAETDAQGKIIGKPEQLSRAEAHERVGKDDHGNASQGPTQQGNDLAQLKRQVELLTSKLAEKDAKESAPAIPATPATPPAVSA